MKECKASLLGGHIDCSTLQGKKCALMLNEGVPEGELSAMVQTFGGFSNETLEMYIRTHSSGGSWAKGCIASPQIVEAATSVLNERLK